MSSPLLNPDDLTLLRANDISFAIEGIFFGILITLFAIGLYHLGRQGLFKGTPSSRGRLLLASVILIMSLSAAGVFIAHLQWGQADLSRIGAGSQNTDVAIGKFNAVAVILGRITFVLGDSIVVWRAWVLYSSDNYRVIIRMILAGCVLGSCVGAFVDAGFNLKDSTNDADGPGTTKYALYVPLLVTNVVATSLVGYKFWLYRRSLRKPEKYRSKDEIRGSSQKPAVEKILIVLLESGFAFFIVWIISALAALGFFGDIGKSVMACITPHLSSIYPTLIIILVALHKSEIDSMTMSSIEFSSSSGRQHTGRSERDIEREAEDNVYPLSFTQATFHTTTNFQQQSSATWNEAIQIGPNIDEYGSSSIQSVAMDESSKSPHFDSVGSVRETTEERGIAGEGI
ncbi:hypothetical protein K435DRAFT_971074 [Dendrothele bispora CBS 962.96]|uniref:Uncharacterized protein n=1 Tax=Dendrothele bispora (strain CBS 962.96) TaxID=1314807 RepID=A0A4V4HCV2_DENBC|nr:hypothetical protein K435DRAFT_971074 [Dendrothele bispora CBS 962.96]